MKLKSTKLLLLLAMIITIPLISGCFTILSVDQVETADAGSAIQVYLEIRTEDQDANPHYGIVGLLIPTDWAVDSVYFSGDFGPDYCEWLHPDSSDSEPGGQVDYWYDSLDVKFPPPEGMQWMVYESSTPYASNLDTGYVDLYIDMTVGNTGGDYNIGYFVSNAALDFSDSTYYDFNWDNPITVTGAAGNNVTFQCDMSIKQREMAFDPAGGDIVVVRGSFNEWGGNDQQLMDADEDTIYTGTFDVGTDPTVEYKHVIHQADGTDVWESIANRTFDNTGDQTLPVVYFDDDDEYTPPADVMVTFQVDMSIKMREEVFLPPEDIVVVRGNFNNWGGNNEECTDADSDSIFTGTFNIGSEPTIYYKYVIHKEDGTDMWEDNVIDNENGNRYFTNTGTDQTLPVVYWDDDDEFSGVSKEGAILFTVDMEVWEDAGFFDRNLDSLMIRGGFNGWASGDFLERFPGTAMFEKIMPVSDIVGNEIYYKYYIKYADTTKWENEDWGYEVPYTQGGGNRSIVFEGLPDQEAPISYMNDIPHGGVIPEGKTITLTFNVDMNPAMTAPVPFNPATDTVTLIPQDPHWAIGQGIEPYTEDLAEFTDTDGDGIYTGSFDIHGPTIYGMEYAFSYGADGITEGGGFDYGRYRTRYIHPNPDGTFPDAWTFPTDVFTEDPPLDVEEPPIAVAVDKLVKGIERPENFQLGQNYPNPFNPTTTISYSVPKFSHVTIKVYNMLGQEVQTLFSGHRAAGNYNISWDANDNFGQAVSGGIYFYHLKAGDYSATKKMLLLK